MESIKLPENVEFIINILNNKGFEAYIVGGCVRDYLLGKTPKDWDITTSALPQQVKSAFSHTYDTGIEHGTVTVLIGKIGYEVTTYRIDGEYKDNRHPEKVIFTDKLTGDLSRRDFTVNAIAYSPKTGIVDRFDGMGDLKRGLIKAVGNADQRFNEDALRMMRALRFSAQLNFEIEEETYSSIKKNAHLIKNISIERIRDELLKLILSDNPLKVYELKATGILSYVLSPLAQILEDNEAEIKACLAKVPKDTVNRLTLILYHLDKKALEKFLRNLRLDNKTVKDTVTLASFIKEPVEYNGYNIRKMISKSDYELTEAAVKLRCIIRDISSEKPIAVLASIKTNNHCCSLADLDLKGEDLIALGVPKGKQIGELLNKCLDEVLKNPQINNKDYLIKEVCNLCTH